MGPMAPLRLAVSVSSLPIRARAAASAVLVLVERLLAPVLAYLLFFRGARAALPIAAVMSVILVVRGSAQRNFAARNEAELYRKAVASVLSGDVLQPTLLPDEEARISLFQALNRVALLLADSVPDLAASIVAACLLSIGLAALEPHHVILVACLALGVGALVVFVSRRRVNHAQTEAWTAWDDVAEGVNDACEGRLELVASGREDAFLHQFGEATDAWEEKARRAARLAGLRGRLPLALVATAAAGAVVVDARLGGADWPLAAVQAGLLASCAPAFLGIARCVQELTSNAPRLRLVERMLRVARSLHSSTGATNAPPRRVEWRAVRFAYGHEGREVLGGVSFEWRAGELLVLAGSNGSGKSTCLRTALGLGDLAGGDVFVDGVPLAELDVPRWRRSIAFLPQRPYLPLRASVRECLRFLDAEVPDAAMKEALERVGMLRTLERESPDPLAAQVGKLSAGERQRVALARALCRDAPLVILDEPDANLDHAGIRRISDLVVELARERMVLVAAHTPELIEVADRVVTLDAGLVLSDAHGKAG